MCHVDRQDKADTTMYSYVGNDIINDAQIAGQIPLKNVVQTSFSLEPVSGKRVLHRQIFLQDILRCVDESYYRCVIATCKMTVVLVSMSRSLTIDHRTCSDKDTKRRKTDRTYNIRYR